MGKNIFLSRPVTSIVISIVIVLVGVLAITILPISKFPDVTPPVVEVTANYTGADAQTVEQTVATPIETQVNGSPGMSYLTSNSTSDGRVTIDATFKVGTNVDIAALDVQNRVSIATPVLPDEVKRLGLTTKKVNPSIMLVLSFFSPKGTHNIQFIENYANVYIRNSLLRVPGVGDVFTFGSDFSMRVWLKPDKLATLGISVNEVLAALAEQNVQVAAGSIGTKPQAANQSFEYTVFVKGRLNKVEEFNKIIVRSNPSQGSIVYLKDVARVELGRSGYATRAEVDGKEACFLLVFQAPNSNALATAEGVYSSLKELKKTFPKDMDYIVPFETVSVVQVSIEEVVTTLAIALALVVFVVFFFLQSWRATLIPLLAIPVSIIGTFILFIPLGFSINTLTLFGFVLAIGIVVDDAIVVVEAVQQYIDNKGLSPKEATLRALKDITGPVIAIALILAAVFVPVSFLPGIVGRLYQQFAITIAISVIISAFVALSLTPVLCMLLLKPMHLDKDSRGLDGFFYRFNTWFDKMVNGYSSNVQRAIKGTPYILVMLVCIFVAAGYMFIVKPTGFIPNEDDGLLIISYELPDASSSARSAEVQHKITKLLEGIPAIGHIGSASGFNGINNSNKSNAGTFFLLLKPWDQRKDKASSLDATIGQIYGRLASVKEANAFVVAPPAISGLGNSSGFSFILEQQQTNDDIHAFERVVFGFMMAANQRPEIAQAFTFFTAHTPAYDVTVDREKCKKLGVSITDVFATMQVFLGSAYINDFTLYGRNFHVLAQADTAYRANIQAFMNYRVRNQQGSMIPLSTIATYKLAENAPLISHYNLYRSVEFNGAAKPGVSSGQAIAALKEVAAKTLPAGYGYEFSGLSREEISSGSGALAIYVLSILFVFLFLAALYESWSVPFSVLLAVPLGIFGAILTLTLVPNMTNNVYAQIGLVTLIGLAAKNAILIVEFAKERVDEGIPVIEATIAAVRLRLRPILMTSFAFILGVLPLVFATGAGAVSRQTIGWTVFGGMIGATSLAIFVVPVLFVLITNLSYSKAKLAELQAHPHPRE